MESRITRDTATGEILEDRHVAVNPARASAAGQRLDRVRDIESVVTLVEKPGHAVSDDETVDLTLDSDAEEVVNGDYRGLAAGVKWADVESD